MKDVSAARILHDLHVYGAAIYGAGNRGKRAYEILSRNCIPVRWVIDQCEGKKLGENDAVQMSHFQNNSDSICIITPDLKKDEYEKIKKETDKIFSRTMDMRLIDLLEYGMPKYDDIMNYNMAKPFGHYESPFPTKMEYEYSRKWTANPCNIKLNIERQLEFVQYIGQQVGEYKEKYNKDKFRFHSNNMFDFGEAMVYHGVIRYFRPNRIIEIGSGYSTAMALDTMEFWDDCHGRVLCIEPYPARLLGILKQGDDKTIELKKGFLQNVLLSEFERLERNDILFIDSSHVLKSGGDVAMEYLQILPHLKPGVVIHIHDIFYPFSYPSEWVAEGRPYNEAFLLQAFLIGNDDYEILFWEDYIEKFHADAWREHCRENLPVGSSFWMRKIA